MFERVGAGIFAGAVGTVAINVVSTIDIVPHLAHGARTVSSFEGFRR